LAYKCDASTYGGTIVELFCCFGHGGLSLGLKVTSMASRPKFVHIPILFQRLVRSILGRQCVEEPGT
jgi:hypothetical protein